MNVAIIGFKNYDAVHNKMCEMIDKTQEFLFNVLVMSTDSIGYHWAKANGAPVIFLDNPTLEEIVNKTDYLVANYDGSPMMHRLIFKYMQSGKHGTVVEEVKYI